MLEKVLRHLRNWFVAPDGIRRGKYEIKGGSIELPFLVEGQYFRIVGSILNDGLYQYPAKDLMDESFSGVIWALAIPRDVLDVVKEIEQWCEKNPSGPFTSESFGGYSYTKAANSATGQPVTWQDAFRSTLNQWRKL